MDFGSNTTKILLAIVAVLAALVATGFIIKIRSKKNNKKVGGVNINRSTISGDVAGRDIKKK